MHARYEVCTSYGSKVIAKVQVDNRQTNRQTNKQTDRQDKNKMPRSFDQGHKKTLIPYINNVLTKILQESYIINSNFSYLWTGLTSFDVNHCMCDFANC